MERSRVAKRFRELGWDPVLPDPQDDRHAREVKTQNLRQALQVRILSLKSYLHIMLYTIYSFTRNFPGIILYS